ncbi:ATP-binding cassette domain-containing protein [Kitasatospora sp. CB01950]|uniref:ATP-binding cassette domain-containing protein n=1 Tax=Kitasatospora sp. CB01950 TaxID=1703930 RepID=UPI00093B13B7|nr:ABC transporter ATP-binding protein [Kitasatospora sp. CB01950]OKJ05555.1 hypothetical protein AMK19_24860 [Kitasatospora sp. CB01950]
MTGRRTAVEALGLGIRHPRRANDPHLLADCSFRVPTGAVCGVVGPNGAGKSLLLSAAAGLVRPTEGRLTVLGQPSDSETMLADIAHVDQERSLYRQLKVAELLDSGRSLNARWDRARAQELLDLGRVPLTARAGTLSGGQRTLVRLALAHATTPRLLLLDEPLADLDPFVRRAVMGLLLADVADGDCTVLLSSHVLADLDEAADHLLLIDAGRVRLAGQTTELLAAHRYLGPADRMPDSAEPVELHGSASHGTALVRITDGPARPGDEYDHPTLEELVIAYVRSPRADSWLAPSMRPMPRTGLIAEPIA